MYYKYFKKNFVEQIETQINDYVGRKCQVMEDRAERVNGSVDALYIMIDGNNIGPVLYPRVFYNALCEGVSMKELVDSALETVKKGIRDMPTIDGDIFREYERVKGLLSVDLIGVERNDKLLQTIPYQKVLDMAAVYRVNLECGKESSGSILITNQMLEQYAITPDQLHKDALLNSQLNKPVLIMGMSELFRVGNMSKALRPLETISDLKDDLMYVATVPDKCRGAGILMYDNFLQDVADKMGEDFYVLPASVHELILLRKSDARMSEWELKNMVKTINREELEPKDRLTDNVYYYDRKKHILEPVDKFEAKRWGKWQVVKKSKSSVRESLKEKQKEMNSQDTVLKVLKEPRSKSRGGEVL